ncbi:YidC/Oxa1 family membrane protein insertase [Proteiniborus sp. MB09-C3]|uniref:YidC/Oxa1 family membrane protein insertase n=1 Tax=Proteiniborus sp. MB09-C3 TaxID=3050072 RepID=UPI002552376E|nr:YidC/Oxa1 family membrane protein insertase [Proteiniborus sp. MB09-C3]WIV12593.1 YidC/Oxa1 family membrane protein insertase [Proteiniborus sp. MB09-C3]
MIDIFAKPLGVLLKFVYDALIGFGLDFKTLSAYSLAIIITTILFKFLLLPLTLKQMKSMKNMQEIQPKIQELNKKYKNDPQTLNQKTMELYKEHKVNPFGGCFPLLIQFPIIIAYFRVMQFPVPYVFSDQAVYDGILKSFLWIKDIGLAPSVMIDGVMNGVSIAGFNIPILAILAAITTYFQSKMMMAAQPAAADGQANSTQATMNIVMPIFILWMGSKYAAGLTLYWTVSNIFQIVQQYFTNRSIGKIKEELK